jgi:hypothetical protein
VSYKRSAISLQQSAKKEADLVFGLWTLDFGLFLVFAES